ncbi:MAG: DUF1553 domain-containing protein [Isosphaeraceae bacterium]|nr:DUF1553 domain-containing protein [Isosphaeraceae bacterium]
MRIHPCLIGPLLFTAAVPALAAERDLGERLDAAVAAAAEEKPAPAADDATFLRRVWLDLAGHVPPALVARDFLDDRDPEKRAKMVDRLLTSHEGAEHWGMVLAVWLIGERPFQRDGYDGRVLREFLSDGLRRGTSYGALVREVITGAGASDVSGAANFLLRYDADPPRLAGAVGKNLLGITIQCAQCHDHPFARWKQDDFWGLAATFARVRRLESSGDDDLKAVLEAKRGELMRPDPNAASADKAASAKAADASKEGEDAPKQVAVKPRLPDGKSVPATARRRTLGDWITAKENPYFARNLVNRLWRELFGQGLVRNLDDLNTKTKAAPVLDLLAEDFTASGHDLKRLLRVVVLSQTYAQASTPRARVAWTRPAARSLSVDQLFGSIAQATGHDGPPPEAADEPEDEANDERKGVEDPDEDEGEEAEPNDRPVEMLGERALTLQRALVLANGEFVRDASRSGAAVMYALWGRSNDAARLDWACLATLSRRPTAAEQAILRPLLAQRDAKAGLEDVFWVLLNSAEFLTNH